MNAIHPNILKWQERDRKRDEAFAKFPPLVAAIASLLPGGPWTVAQGNNNDHCRIVTRSDGLAIYFYLDNYKGRIEIKPSVPRYNATNTLRGWGVVPYDAPKIETSISVDRNPLHAAGQIMRDVIAPYAPLYPMVLEAMRRSKAQTNGAVELACELAKTLGEGCEGAVEALERGDRGSIHCRTHNRSISLHVAPSGGHVTIERFDLGPDAARSFAQWLATRNAPLNS